MKALLLGITVLSCCSLGIAQQAAAPAQPVAAQSEDAKIKALEERISALEAQVQALTAALTASGGTAQPAQTQAAQPQPGQGQAAPSGAAAQQAGDTAAAAAAAAAAGQGQAPTETATLGGASGQAKALNPDISAIGDFIADAGRNPFTPYRALEMHESEVALQSIVDPYARADFFISFGEEGVNLEEGYITLTALPHSFVAKVGKMRAAFGKVNTLHNHVLPWADRPLVTYNLAGGEDGINDAGLSVQRILPAPKWLFLEGTGQVFRGDSSDVFRSSRKNDASVVGHLRGYHDINDNTNIDLGLSYARGHNDSDLFGTYVSNLYGVDATLRWKPLQRAIYHSFIGRAEAIWNQRQQFALDRRAFGWYASADYQLARRWFVGGRYDWSDHQRNFSHDSGGSLVLTYWPSEFAQIRGQYRNTRYGIFANVPGDAPGTNPNPFRTNELLMQVQFAIGAHGAHPF